jgi:hypothetical protein
MKMGRTSPKSTKPGKSIRITQIKQYKLITVVYMLTSWLLCLFAALVLKLKGVRAWSAGQQHWEGSPSASYRLAPLDLHQTNRT